MLGILLTMFVFVVVMIGFNALYVAGEFAAVSARKTRVVQAANEGSRLAQMLLPVIEDSHKLDNYIAASQVGITISSVVLGIYGQQQIAPRIEPLLAEMPFISQLAAAGISATVVLIILTTLQVILGELVPKSIAIQYPEQTAMATVMPMRWSADLVLRPLIILLNGSGALLMRAMGLSHEGGHRHVHSPEEIGFLIEQSHQGGLLNAEERELLGNALRIGDLSVADIVVPRTKMIAVEVNTPIVDVLRLTLTSHFTRIPVYEEDIDHILGLVHLKDLFSLYQKDKNVSVRKCMRKASFVPETMSINDVWERLNKDATYMAIVFDEFGGTVGIVTREDFIEEIFGDVQDEFDEEEEQLVIKMSETEYRVHGEVSLPYLNSKLSLSLSTEDAHTLNGLLVHELERMPEVGDEVVVDKVHVHVESVGEHMADKLVLTLPTEEDETENES